MGPMSNMRKVRAQPPDVLMGPLAFRRLILERREMSWSGEEEEEEDEEEEEEEERGGGGGGG